jgi:hypothetical protein
MDKEWNKVFNVTTSGFEDLALEIFQYQYQFSSVYKAYVDMLKIDPQRVNSLLTVPFLPIQFFKTHTVKTTDFNPVAEFISSGTTQMVNSRHVIKDIGLYQQSFTKNFKLFYGSVDNWCIIGLLPSYLERNNSSLVYMVNELIHKSHHPQSGFYLDEYEKLHQSLKQLEADKQKTLLIGVSYALLDFAEQYSLQLENTIVMETGGMKGRKPEMVRNELHEILKKRFHLNTIHSEYGMTELLSQAYSKGNGIFRCPPWMKILIRDEEDPFTVQNSGSGMFTMRGAINVIDLANIYSCSFIATDDAGTVFSDGSFELLGRMDNSDIRGCSLLTI